MGKKIWITLRNVMEKKNESSLFNVGMEKGKTPRSIKYE